jgi:hypothetical protein
MPRTTPGYIELRAISRLSPHRYKEFRRVVERGYVRVKRDQENARVVRHYARYCTATKRPYIRIMQHAADFEVAVDLAPMQDEAAALAIHSQLADTLAMLYPGATPPETGDPRLRLDPTYVALRGLSQEGADRAAVALFALTTSVNSH